MKKKFIILSFFIMVASSNLYASSLKVGIGYLYANDICEEGTEWRYVLPNIEYQFHQKAHGSLSIFTFILATGIKQNYFFCSSRYCLGVSFGLELIGSPLFIGTFFELKQSKNHFIYFSYEIGIFPLGLQKAAMGLRFKL